MTHELVSVVVPIYNVEEYLEECVDSILAQSYKNTEIILVDDGSTDDSGKKCDEYRIRDDRIIVIHKDNQGLVMARKTGMNASTGEYIVNVDGDDVIEPQMIERLVDRIKRDCSDIVQCGYIEFGENNKCMKTEEYSVELDDEKKKALIEGWLSGKPSWKQAIWNKLYRKKLFIEGYQMVPDEIERAEDAVAYLEIIHRANRISSINDVLYKYRIRNDSKSRRHCGIKQIISLDRTKDYLADSLISGDFQKYASRELVEKWFLNSKIHQLKETIKEYGGYIQQYKYANVNELRGKRVAIYGAGNVGLDYYIQLTNYDDISVVAWVDERFDKYWYGFREVNAISYLEKGDYDYLVIAVKDRIVSDEIQARIIGEFGVDKMKIRWSFPVFIFESNDIC